MKAIQISAPQSLSVIEKEAPTLGEGEVLLQINYVGFCGSDLNTFRGRNLMVHFPVIPGHEISAVIEKVGPGVPDSFQKGQRVTVNPYTSCGRCASCRKRHPNACEHNETLGVQRNGAMCEQIALPWQKIIPVTDPQIEAQHIALIEPLSVGFHAVDRVGLTDSDTIMVIGCGIVGIGAMIRAHLRGATVIAVDVDDDKLALVRSFGVDYVINSVKENLPERLHAIAPLGPDVIIEAVGLPATYRTAVESIGFSGRIGCIGYAATDATLPTRLFVQKELTIIGSRNALPSDFEAVIRCLSRHIFPVEKLVSNVVKPTEAADAMKAWSANPANTFRILVAF